MAWFTVETIYTADRDKLAAVRPLHREYLGRLAAEGKVTGAGPVGRRLRGVRRLPRG